VTKEEIRLYLERFYEQRAVLGDVIEEPTCDDLGKCREHRRPVNLCRWCWPQWLKHLGNLCVVELQKKAA
jgi:hypothetical protein